MTQPINGNDLLALDYPDNELLGIALKANKKRNGFKREEMLLHYAEVLKTPEAYRDHPVFGKLADAFIQGVGQPREDYIPLREEQLSFAIYGKEHIEEGALKQMNTALRLPVAVGGALMPDAHQGYGLPIGGVLATRNAVIPYGVGVDIGCRMALSVYDLPVEKFEADRDGFARILFSQTQFGAGAGFKGTERAEHAVLDHPLFSEDGWIAKMKDKAWAQLGSSGGGNHFVEFGYLTVDVDDAKLGLTKGTYLALLSHSGSRGLGASIAAHYTRLAKDLCQLPVEARNLAYLDLDSEAGDAYWKAMNLAGDYASACHEIIHQKMARALGAERLAQVENHHNFAWKENWNGEEVIVHRKGATPAGKDIMGIIPGSMTAPGFLVRGKGEGAAIHSASHGAGRLMSRTKALETISKKDMQQALDEMGVTLLGAGRDEAPMAYKNIHTVMAAQTDLVDVLASFQPKMVRMADDGSRED